MLKLIYGPGDTLDMEGIELEWPEREEQDRKFKAECKDCGREIEWGEKVWVHQFLDEIKDRNDYDWRIVSSKVPLVSCDSCHSAYKVFTKKELTIKAPIVSIYFWKSVMISLCDLIHDGMISKFDVDLKKLDERALRKFSELVLQETMVLRETLGELEDDEKAEEIKKYLTETLRFYKEILEPVQIYLVGHGF
jgi:hypothetical protein